MLKQILKTFLILGVFFAAPGAVSASPAVTNISGVISHDSVVTVNGTNFGIKSPAAPLLWDDFSRGVSGQRLDAPAGSPWVTPISTCPGYYSNTVQYGQGSVSAKLFLLHNASCWTRTTPGLLGDQTQMFLSYHYYVDGGGGTHTKMGRMGCGDDVHCTPNMGYTAFSPNYFYSFAANTTLDPLSEKSIADMTGISGQWVRDDTWSKLGTDDIANGNVSIWRNGVEAIYNLNHMAVRNKGVNSHSNAYNQVFLPYYNEVEDRTVYVGDVYIDNTLARAEICNSSTKNGSNHCEIQIPQTTWNDGQLQIKINQGSFPDNSVAYLYVIDADGNVNASGKQITFGSSTIADTTAPTTTASPTGSTFTSAQNIALSANEAATIYYTTNGSTPTTSSTTYSAPINISATTTLKYFAKDSAGNSETPKTQIYTINIPVTYNISNLLTLVTNWLKTGTVSDVNADNVVNTRDLGIMMSKWN